MGIIEDISVAIVKEYLKKGGFADAYEVFKRNVEKVKYNESRELYKTLHVSKVSPYKTVLDNLVYSKFCEPLDEKTKEKESPSILLEKSTDSIPSKPVRAASKTRSEARYSKKESEDHSFNASSLLKPKDLKSDQMKSTQGSVHTWSMTSKNDTRGFEKIGLENKVNSRINSQEKPMMDEIPRFSRNVHTKSSENVISEPSDSDSDNEIPSFKNKSKPILSSNQLTPTSNVRGVSASRISSTQGGRDVNHPSVARAFDGLGLSDGTKPGSRDNFLYRSEGAYSGASNNGSNRPYSSRFSSKGSNVDDDEWKDRALEVFIETKLNKAPSCSIEANGHSAYGGGRPRDIPDSYSAPRQHLSSAPSLSKTTHPSHQGSLYSRSHNASSQSTPRGEEALIMDDVDDDFGADNLRGSGVRASDSGKGMERMGGRSGSALGNAANAITKLMEQGQYMSRNEMNCISKLLWREKGQPPLSYRQGFFFRPFGREYPEVKNLSYGLIQLAGGPCGVFAAVQAYILLQLGLADRKDLNQDPSRDEIQDALVNALAEILWNVGSKAPTAFSYHSSRSSSPPPPRTAALAIPGPNGSRSTHVVDLSYDDLCSNLRKVEARSEIETRSLVRAAVQEGWLTAPRGWGLVLFMISLILSAGGEAQVREHMDSESKYLLGDHDYCTQDLVNLILTGRATTNTFDGDKELGGDSSLHNAGGSRGQSSLLLKGISSPCKVGFLALNEWYLDIVVGSFFKNPIFPVWVVFSESHFTVFAACDKKSYKRCLASAWSRPLGINGTDVDTEDRRRFDLIYYDSLAKQSEQILWTIDNDPNGGLTKLVGNDVKKRSEVAKSGMVVRSQRNEMNVQRNAGSVMVGSGKWDYSTQDYVSPLELVIETRWPGCSVNWNGVEKIL